MRRLFVLMAVLMVSLASIGQGKKSIIINERIGHGADSVLALESYNLFKKYDEKYQDMDGGRYDAEESADRPLLGQLSDEDLRRHQVAVHAV